MRDYLRKKFSNNSGVTLIEIIVAMTIFAFLMLSVVSIFQFVIEGERSAMSAINIQENLRYVFEAFSKELRMAKRSDQECRALLPGLNGFTDNRVYNTATLSSSSSTVLFFKNEDDDCVYYYLNATSSALWVAKNSGTGVYSARVTPSDVDVSSVFFSVRDNAVSALPGSLIQPFVTFRVNAFASTTKQMHRQDIFMQTSVSARDYQY